MHKLVSFKEIDNPGQLIWSSDHYWFGRATADNSNHPNPLDLLKAKLTLKEELRRKKCFNKSYSVS